MVHRIKCWKEYMPALADGSKTYELRKDDRNYQVGDTLILCGWDKDAEVYTGEELVRLVTYKGEYVPGWGLEPGYCILGMRPLSAFELYGRCPMQFP